MAQIVFVLNGPNLNMLGKREPAIYGHETLADVQASCQAAADRLGFTLRFHQSNREYELIDWIHEARQAAGIVINPAAFTHTSVAIHDALAMCEGPILEVHISNVHKREAFRHHSYVSSVASGVIAGFGTQGYLLALERLAHLLAATMTNAPSPKGELTIRIVAMPSDTNPSGDIFGGWIMGLMDLSAGIAARDHANGRVVTASVSSLSFLRPVKVGDVVCCYTTITGTGRSSITMEVEAWVVRDRRAARLKVTEAKFVMVAVDADGRPRPVTASA